MDDIWDIVQEPRFVGLKELDDAVTEYLAHEDDEDADLEQWAGIIDDYILRRYWDQNIREFTLANLSKEFNILLIDHIQRELVKKGILDELIDENGNAVYRLKELNE